MKRCNCCGRVHSRLGWRLLPLLGTTQLEPYDPVSEWRNCPCGSTLVSEYYPEERWTAGEITAAIGALLVGTFLAVWASL
jgi:hypothetical protein